ncbi:hypothetical protein XENOCAPTIV_008268, partial [Xenoophorus captivus]
KGNLALSMRLPGLPETAPLCARPEHLGVRVQRGPDSRRGGVAWDTDEPTRSCVGANCSQPQGSSDFSHSNNSRLLTRTRTQLTDSLSRATPPSIPLRPAPPTPRD